MDIAGPFWGQIFLIIINAHSKWLDANIMASQAITDKLKITFATLGLPEWIITRIIPRMSNPKMSK